MKMVMAIVKPFKLDDIREALYELDIQGMTVSDVMGCGRQQGQSDADAAIRDSISFLPKTKLEVAVTDDKVDDVIKAIQDSATTGRIGDGKIFVYDLSRTVRIRTGEKDKEAL
ncbi:MAG: P-II family nitrogen regulator [Alphaproteobacteria bacterium]|jgi:nitrogen regulatory protein P-II 2|nr:P-II family nitrogen regulator [Alphaproteobacteria bacterium]MDP7221829.1 P-II family nitrogen regulator [Alphaproteobacteria bacterium]